MSDYEVQAFWERFLSSPAARSIPDPQLYEAMRIGSDPDDANLGAALILERRKTATSSLPGEYNAHPGPPYVGALSIVVDGSGQPVAVVETVEVELRKLANLDDTFARDYGEWDRTAETLKSKLRAYYRAQSTSERDDAGRDLELLCERFRVIYSER